MNVTNARDLLQQYNALLAEEQKEDSMPEEEYFTETEIKMENVVEEEIFEDSQIKEVEEEDNLNTIFETDDEIIQECTVCCDVFSNRKTLADHRQKVHKTSYIYQVQHLIFVFDSNLLIILILFQCNYCVSNFKSLKDLQDHHESTHDSNVPQICETCGMEFSSK